MNTETKTSIDIINKFLQENDLRPRDLARFLDTVHGYSCYKDTQYD